MQPTITTTNLQIALHLYSALSNADKVVFNAKIKANQPKNKKVKFSAKEKFNQEVEVVFQELVSNNNKKFANQ